MSKRNIHIERLQIRTRGILAKTARTVVGELGHELLSQLSTTGALNGMRGRVRIGKVDGGIAQIVSGTGAAALRNRIAKQIAESIIQRSLLPQKGKDAK